MPVAAVAGLTCPSKKSPTDSGESHTSTKTMPSSDTSGPPAGSHQDRHQDEGTGGRIGAVLRVLRLQELERTSVLLDDSRPPVEPHPPQARPVLVPVVDQHLDRGVRLDVREPLEPARRLGLRVDRGVERVAVEREADRDDVWAAVPPYGREPPDPGQLRRRRGRA